ncbi:MAG TPA: response regulator [Anaeromyxobacteraceae bacterium]|jgi:CheY-like chemotaxis protein|nr:response regulator [Anaeromyxobacteraceae bacterium]
MTADRDVPRALVVDDEEDVREMVAIALRTEGYSVTAVRDGATAVRTVRTAPFDVVTLDFRMPGMGGLETLSELKKTAPRLPVIIVSGYVASAEVRTCHALGAFAVIRKPFELEDLLAVLHRARAPGMRDRPPAS